MVSDEPDTYALNDWSQQLSDAAALAVKHRSGEEELRLDVHGVIVQAAADLYKLDVLGSTAERPGSKKVRRHYDNLYGGVVVEFEWRMTTSRREHGAKQALEYLADIRDQVGDQEVFTAVVTDGQEWGFLAIDPAEELTLLDELPATYSDYFEWRSNDAAACRRFLELIGSHEKHIINSANLKASYGPSSAAARKIVLLLLEVMAARGSDDRASVLFAEWRRALDVAYGTLNKRDRQVADAIEATYEVKIDRPVSEYLFVLHTYFALVARLVAVELLAIASDDAEFRPTSWHSLPIGELVERLEGLEQGALPGGLTMDNLFESDVFGWWLGAAKDSVEIANAVVELLGLLAKFAFPRAALGPQRASDVLRDLYESLIPRVLRKKLGEFLTPHWLAQSCLERLQDAGAPVRDGRVLDPTCGTGTFLIPLLGERLSALRRTNTKPTPESVQHVLDTVTGVDINPVAVTATRVNMVLALGSLAGVGHLTLPVWRADSLLVPDAPPRQGSLEDADLAGTDFLELETSLPSPFRIPRTMATASRLATLRRAIDATIANVDTSKLGRSEAIKQFEANISVQFGPGSADPVGVDAKAWQGELAVANHLFGQIYGLSAKNQDGIWAQIIANSYAPLFAGRFDIVVGNPPWLAWGRLPEAWRRGSERLWRKFGLWKLPKESRDTGGTFAVGDIAQLVFAVSVERYATDDGYIGLLTPRALLIADPGARAFRKFHLKSEPGWASPTSDVKFKPIHVDDWSEVKPFAPLAANSPIFLVTRRGAAASYPVPGTVWRRGVRGVRLGDTWRHVRPDLEAVNGDFRPSDPGSLSSAWLFQSAGAPEFIKGGTSAYDFGIGLHTRGANGIYIIRIVRSLPQQGKVEVENLPTEGKNRTVKKRRGIVEAELVYPYLKGRDVTAWAATPKGYILVPHDPMDFTTPLTDNRLQAGGNFGGAGAFLRQFKSILSSRKPPPQRKWNLEGEDWCRLEGPLEYLRSDHIVVVREIAGAPVAAVVDKKFAGELGRTVAPLIDHKLLFCAVGSHLEACYLAAFVNSTPVQDFLKGFANKIGVTPRALRTIPVPRYDAASVDAHELADLGAQIGAEPSPARAEEAAKVQPLMDAAVLRLMRHEGEYVRQPQRRSEPRRAAQREDAPLPGLE